MILHIKSSMKNLYIIAFNSYLKDWEEIYRTISDFYLLSVFFFFRFY